MADEINLLCPAQVRSIWILNPAEDAFLKEYTIDSIAVIIEMDGGSAIISAFSGLEEYDPYSRQCSILFLSGSDVTRIANGIILKAGIVASKLAWYVTDVKEEDIVLDPRELLMEAKKLSPFELSKNKIMLHVRPDTVQLQSHPEIITRLLGGNEILLK